MKKVIIITQADVINNTFDFYNVTKCPFALAIKKEFNVKYVSVGFKTITIINKNESKEIWGAEPPFYPKDYEALKVGKITEFKTTITKDVYC